MRFPIPTSHQKIPFTGKGSLDEYAYSFLSDLAELHLIFISFSISSTMLLVAPESTYGAFPLHGTARYGTVRFTFGGFSTGYCTWYLILF